MGVVKEKNNDGTGSYNESPLLAIAVVIGIAVGISIGAGIIARVLARRRN